jgi:aspartate-semialdehyde dehydrogenase
MSYRLGIVGATGAVGQELIELIHQRGFPCELRLLASARSAGKTISYKGKTWTIEETRAEVFSELDVAIFSAGSSTSKELGWEAVKRGCIVIDNSSCFRMDANVPLVVPEINPEAALAHKGIIANPNCSTAITLMALYPLHKAFGLKRFVASTYQAVSGTGAAAIRELEAQVHAWTKGEPMVASVYKHQIAFNAFPHVDSFLDTGYTKEEMKMLNEGRKIMDLPSLEASTTCVRIPVLRAHSISVEAQFERPVDVAQARAAIEAFPGVEMRDDPANAVYPMPWDYSGRENCGVGRLRKSAALENGLALWVVGDQLWKGAALNAVQIAELLHARGAIRK